VTAKVVAINSYGNSAESVEGNGAVITTTPDAPISLAENTSLRTKSQLALTWSAATFTGGATIDNYRINYREQGGSYSVLASGLTDASYTATGLTAGTTYEFTVEAQTSYGYSSPSSSISLLCAFTPEAPTTVSTSNTND
jgi:hypothetical protein